MKLNKRVSVIILPVLLIIFALLSVGFYAIERRSVYFHYRNTAELEAMTLARLFTQYSHVAQSFLFSLIQSESMRQYLDSENEPLSSRALQEHVNSMLNDQMYTATEHFSLAFLRSNREVEYINKNVTGPLSQVQPYHKKMRRTSIFKQDILSY